MVLLCGATLRAFAGETPTILALGDSITARRDSYRNVLVPTLTEKRLAVEFIGPNKDEISAHAGYGGKNTAYLLSISKDVYSKYPADIVMIHSGHNSFSKDNPVQKIVSDTKAIIENIRRINPKVTILLAQVIPAGKLPKYSYIPELNRQLETLSKRLISEDSKLILVNQEDGFDWKTDTINDKVHPNASGAKKMAAKWMDALLPLLEKKETLWHPSQDATWELSFGDDFEGRELDTNKWFSGYRLGRVEYYTRIGYPHAHTRDWQPNPPLAHYVMGNGVLCLRVDKALPKRDKPTTKTVSGLTSAIYRYDEKSGEFLDKVKFSQKCGWWEIRCRMPVCGSGAYTAFWLHSVGARNQEYSPEGVRQGNPAGKSPAVEIDIFEWLGRQPDKNLFNVHFTKNGGYEFGCPCDLTKDFHVWAINWEDEKITWYLDNRPVHVYEGPTPAGKMYLLMAMFQIGGWVGDIADPLPYPMDFEVDYVRVWKKKVIAPTPH